MIVEEKEMDENQGLVEDLVAISTSFSARIDGKRGGRKVTEKITSIWMAKYHENDHSCLFAMCR